MGIDYLYRITLRIIRKIVSCLQRDICTLTTGKSLTVGEVFPLQDRDSRCNDYRVLALRSTRAGFLVSTAS